MTASILPIFKSHYSLGRSILTVDPAEPDIDESKPISIFTIAHKYQLPEIYLVDNSMSGFVEAIENAEDAGILLRFGVQLFTCSDMNTKTEASRLTESKIIVWLNNTNGYESLLKIVSKANTDGFYYHGRIDWDTLISLWDSNLRLSINFYDGFIHKNILTHQSCCVPNFGNLKPLFIIEPLHDLPFDDLIINNTLNYCNNHHYDILYAHTCHYYKESDAETFQTFRCIHERTTLDKPELRNFGSKKFAFETWLNYVGKPIKA